MKKYFTLILVGLNLLAQGQQTNDSTTTGKANFYITLTTTLTFTNFSGDYVDEIVKNNSDAFLDYNNGITPSIQLKYEFLSENLYTKTGLSYIQKGKKEHL
jgi:hypothetical protein